ncbi:hypothetical protein FD754_012923 [Muntiacus muntjak]|uniref:C-type lectin domain-containing protein n=1 Tax=Muntiacus muntjak TaxID=9888 RepID=A0A5N3VIY5_MUNMU|nr:hypothetical protein FD754_012923 [Muntiacus muntjak]
MGLVVLWQVKSSWTRDPTSLPLVSDSLQSHGLYSPWNSSGQNTGMGSLSLLQGLLDSLPAKPQGRSRILQYADDTTLPAKSEETKALLDEKRSVLLTCPMHWQQIQHKCFYFHETSKPWSDGLADCSTRESSLLLIQDQEELINRFNIQSFLLFHLRRFIQNLINKEGILFWIGLNFTLSEKSWKWINGSFLNSNIRNISKGKCILLTKTYSELLFVLQGLLSILHSHKYATLILAYFYFLSLEKVNFFLLVGG